MQWLSRYDLGRSLTVIAVSYLLVALLVWLVAFDELFLVFRTLGLVTGDTVVHYWEMLNYGEVYDWGQYKQLTNAGAELSLWEVRGWSSFVLVVAVVFFSWVMGVLSCLYYRGEQKVPFVKRLVVLNLALVVLLLLAFTDRVGQLLSTSHGIWLKPTYEGSVIEAPRRFEMSELVSAQIYDGEGKAMRPHDYVYKFGAARYEDLRPGEYRVVFHCDGKCEEFGGYFVVNEPKPTEVEWDRVKSEWTVSFRPQE